LEEIWWLSSRFVKIFFGKAKHAAYSHPLSFSFGRNLVAVKLLCENIFQES
jgi:hypothetical protein